MKNLILIVALVSMSIALSASIDQDKKTNTLEPYLSITLEDHQNVNYPPGTSFILQNEAGQTILNQESLGEIGSYKIVGEHSLYVFPSWKNTPDSFDIKNGKVELKKHKIYKKKKETKNSYVPSDGNMRIERKMLFASDYGNQKNVSIIFTNGITFYYRDGEVQAWLNGKELNIEGAYVITSELGVLKLSFNPNNGEIWYVFESKQE